MSTLVGYAILILIKKIEFELKFILNLLSEYGDTKSNMIKILKQIGLSEKEIRVYFTILKIGSSSAQKIALETGIKRTTVYLILEKLKDFGLIGEIIEKNKKMFFAEKPKKLLKIIQEKKKEIEKEEARVKKILPRFEKILKEKGRESNKEITHYQGLEGIWNIAEDMLKTKKDHYAISPGKIYDYLGLSRFLSDITKKRRQIGGTKAYIIADYHPQSLKFYREGDTDFREVRFLPEVKNFNSAVVIYGEKVALISLKKPFSSILIENKEIYSLVKFMWDVLWERLEGKNLPD